MRVRLEDVARAAKVSPKTVSRVLNDEPNVTDATRETVRAAMEAMNYRPLASARSLAGKRSFVIAMLYDNNDNPSSIYLAEIQDGMLEACDAHRYSMMMRPLRMRGDDFIGRLDQLISDHHPDGVVLTPPITDYAPLLKRLRDRDVPYASVSPLRRGKVVGVMMDEQQAARSMVEYLIGLGHRRIAHVTGIANHGASRWRLEGYRDALAAAGLKVGTGMEVQGAFTFGSGVEAARKLFARKNRPTAIFAANDDMAAGVMWVAGEFGLKVPQDVSVCGFDDTPLAGQLLPPLTTIRQPAREMGRLAALQLLERVRGRPAELVQVAYSLQVRASTAPPKS